MTNLLIDLKEKKIDMSYGSPYDRGSADYYYSRKRFPHKYPNGTYNGEMVILTDPIEIAEYNQGYDECTDTKDWGD
jgi:hypothetical protein